jgi:4-oxalocrotonate tautomerase
MPVVVVQMFEGRTVEQKRKLVRAITDAMIEHAGAKPDALHVAIQEYSKENWARSGVLGTDREDLKGKRF